MTKNEEVGSRDHPMVSEKKRLESYRNWPYNDGNLTKEKMAKAGFYHCPATDEPDAVRCFCCFKGIFLTFLKCFLFKLILELEGWDENDDPWHEHRQHSGHCYFANLSKPEGELTVSEFITVLRERYLNMLVSAKD